MAKVRESACNGCAECIHCGRSHQFYTYYECDSCGDEAEYWYDDKDYCESCLLEALKSDGVIEDIPEEDDD